MQDDKLQWKLALDYDVKNGNFVLYINDKAFLSLPYKASLAPPGPQNIEMGTIELNGVQVHKGYAQYTTDLLDKWCSELNIQSSVTEAYIEGLVCTSSETLNLVFEDLGRNIDQ